MISAAGDQKATWLSNGHGGFSYRDIKDVEDWTAHT